MLTARNLTFAYPGNSVNTISDISFSIDTGEAFGFLGPSGAGKSTTQKILYKLLKGYSGEVLFKDRPLQNWGREFYEHIGVSFELPNHYLKLTALENLTFFASFYKNQPKNIHALLEKVGLENDADKLVADYSKGMKMRLNFVRALVHEPDVLFLDEPTSGLDPINAGKIKQIIHELKQQGKTIFITTHNMFDADQLCDRVALLHKGVVQALDTPEVLKRKHGSRTVKISLTNSQQEHIFPMENLGQNAEFLKLIAANDIATMHSQEATLEEVFITITGQQLA